MSTNTNLYNILKERGLLYQCTDEEALTLVVYVYIRIIKSGINCVGYTN